MEWNIPNTASTKFRLGSITKQFTSMLIMQLVEQGKLKLNGKITDYLPDYPKATGSKITIHHLLTHTSGIPSYTSFPKFFETMSRDPYTPDAFVKKFSGLPLEFEPGSTFSYDNSGYFLLGVIIEKITGKPYAEVLKETILTPLAMNDTGYDLAEPILSKRASGYEKRSEGYVNAPYLDMSIPYAAGSLYSTVEDLYRWDQALYTDKLLADSVSKATMFTPFLNHYAYGWGVSNMMVGQLKDSLLLIEHGGGINGFNTLISRIPADKRLVVLLNNTGGAPLNTIRKNIVNILYNQPVEIPGVRAGHARELEGPHAKLRAFLYAERKARTKRRVVQLRGVRGVRDHVPLLPVRMRIQAAPRRSSKRPRHFLASCRAGRPARAGSSPRVRSSPPDPMRRRGPRSH